MKVESKRQLFPKSKLRARCRQVSIVGMSLIGLCLIVGVGSLFNSRMNDHRVLNAQTVSNGDAIDPETHKASPEWNVPSDELAVLAEGADMFNRLCAACHGADGGGLLGPNVTDAYWIHGATFAENCQVVENGVPDKGMPAYLDSLSRDEIRAVVSYMFTLRGAGPDDAKEPEGIYVAESGGRAIVPEATD